MSDQRIAEMISKIAHELRSPLTSIKGFSSMLTTKWDRFSDEQRLEFVETIAYDADRMSRIVGEVLDLARIEAGRLELRIGRVEVRPLVAKVAGQLGPPSGNDRVENRVEPGLMVWADPDRLGHVLFNLVENGLKFSDSDPVTVSAGQRADGSVEISVADRGVGIAPERRDEIFSGPGHSAGGEATPLGAGLGLYLARRVTEAHGGTISVDGAVGSGSTFMVSLPPAGEPGE